MEIQQHDGVVEVARIPVGLRQALTGGRGVTGGREAPGLMIRLPSLPSTIYRGPGGAPAPGRSNLQGGRRPRGVACPPSQVGRPPPLGFPTLGAREAQGGHTSPPGLVPFPLQPMGPSGIGGPTRWTPETLPVVPVQYRLPPKLSRWPKLDFLYI